jgi:hypothetical protein
LGFSLCYDAEVSSSSASTAVIQKGRLQSAASTRWVFWITVALVGGASVFLLPFAWPLKTPTFSNSYPYGFNNRIAELSAALTSAAVLLILWMRRMGRTPREMSASEAMPRRWLLFGAVVAVIFTAGLGAGAIHAKVYYSDASFFMIQIDRVLHDHAVLYRDVEFPYGPILFYWPALTQWAFRLVGISPAASYLFTLALMQVLGLGLLFFILERLPLTRATRKLFFAVCIFATLTPLLGLNYTLLRFLLPHAMFLAIARRRSLSVEVALFALGQIVAMGFSPEIGVAFLGGTVVYALYRCFKDGPLWLVAAVSPLAASFLFSSLIGNAYFSTMRRFAFGAFNLVVTPDFHILILLTAAVALSPIAVAGFLQTDHPRAAAMLGFYVISLGMMGPALGRCDALHTFFGGLGVYLLSLIAVDGIVSRPARLWVIALAAAIVYSQLEDIYIYRVLLQRALVWGPPHNDGVDLSRLETLTGGEPIATPFTTSKRVMDELSQRGQRVPSYFVFMDTWDDADERQKISELRRAPFALIPNFNYQITHDGVDQGRMLPLLHTHLHYRQRFRPWRQGVLIAKELREHWTPVGSVGLYTVYRQNPA